MITGMIRIPLHCLVVSAIVAIAAPARAIAAMTRYVVEPAQCELITFVAEPLTHFQKSAVGNFAVRSGEISGDPASPASGASVKLVFDSSSYSSGNTRLDRVVTHTVLDSADYPDITFKSTGLQDVAIDQTGAGGSALVNGELTLRGETRSMSALVSVVLEGQNELVARGEVTFRYPKFGLPVPAGFLGLFHASDQVTVKFRIVAKRAAS